MSRERLGVFGGTFDPPHIGHFTLASSAFKQMHLDHMLWMLAPIPPHKRQQVITPLEHRLAMLKLLIANEPNFQFSGVELDRPGPHYTIDTMRLLADQHPSADLILLIGADSLHELASWQHPVDLVSACHQIGVFQRPEDTINLSEMERHIRGIQAKVQVVEAPLIDISSRKIRDRIRENLGYRDQLTPDVYAYIEKNKLYQ